MTEDEMVGWHHQLNGHEFEYAPGVGDEQGGLESCSSRGRKESIERKRLKKNNNKYVSGEGTGNENAETSDCRLEGSVLVGGSFRERECGRGIQPASSGHTWHSDVREGEGRTTFPMKLWAQGGRGCCR